MTIYNNRLFTITKGCKQPNIHQKMSGHTKRGINIYSGLLFSLEKGKVLVQATTRVSLENIVLSEISQTQKAVCSVILRESCRYLK